MDVSKSKIIFGGWESGGGGWGVCGGHCGRARQSFGRHVMKTVDADDLAAIGPAGHERKPVLRTVLTSAIQGIQVDAWRISQQELPLATSAAWSVKKHTLRGGKQAGVEVIEVDNGRLKLVVSPTRGMSILRVESGDVRLGWDSPVKEVVHPQFINLESRGGLGWLEGFNEWLVRCGLEWAGHPGKDRFRNNVGEEVEMDLTLHGKIGNIPASEVEVVVEAGPPPRIIIRGLVEERMFYGPKLALWTSISTEIGSNTFRVEDAVTNHGAHDQEFQIIYHANFGPPLLGAGSRFLGAVERVTPFNARAAENLADFAAYTGPQTGFIEQVYCLRPLADAAGQGLILLQNASGDRAVSMAFPVAQLPYVTLWKNLAAEAEGYVTGLEPGTGFPATRRRERAAGRVPKLAPGETRHFTLDVAIQADRAAVAAAVARVRGIQGERAVVLDTQSLA